MKKLKLILLLSIFSITAHAQEEPAAFAVETQFNLWNFKTQDSAYVFADVAYVRENPNLQAEITDSLSQGNQVMIKSEGYNGQTIRGFYAPWHEISYVKNNQKKKGFIWLGLLALDASRNEKGELFIYGFSKSRILQGSEARSFECELKVFNPQHEFLTKEIIHAEINGQSGTETKIMSGMGLKNIRNIHKMAFLAEACGIPSLSYYFAWNGTNLIHLPETKSVSDAGVFYLEESLVFPSQHQGKSGMIYKNSLDGENTSTDPDKPKYKETKTQVEYSWDGKIISEIMNMN